MLQCTAGFTVNAASSGCVQVAFFPLITCVGRVFPYVCVYIYVCVCMYAIYHKYTYMHGCTVAELSLVLKRESFVSA